MRAVLSRFWHDEAGATAIEYALLGTLIAVAIVASLSVLGPMVGNLFGAGGAGSAGDAIGAAANRL